MTRVDFYVLPEEGGDDALPTACRLCEKAVHAGHRVHAHVPDADRAAAFDKLLWTFRQGSFVAHERAGGPDDASPAAVLIGDAEPPADRSEVLLNLADDVPGFFSRFERVLEVVHGDADRRAAYRGRFKWYKDRGYDVATHKL